MPERMPITEDFPLVPVNHYGWTKLFFERILDSCKTYGLENVCLRYFNAAGAGYNIGEDHSPETHLVPLILKTALKQRENIKIFGTDYPTPDGTCIRDYIDINDLINAHILALNIDSNETINLGSGKGYSVKELVDTFNKTLNKKIQYDYGIKRKGDPAILLTSIDKARQILKWNPKKTLQDMIKSTNGAYK